MKKTLLLLVISFAFLMPFFRPGFFKTDDGDWMIIRFSAFHQELVSGQFPVRFTQRLNNNYGYPVINFLYPLPFYLAEIPYIITRNFTQSIKIIFIFSTAMSILAMYWALRKRFSIKASFAGSIVYLIFPYRLIDLYVRGSIGEIVAFVFIPICLGSIFEISNGKKIYYPVLSVSIALLILSHNIMAVIFTPLLFILAILYIKTSFAKITSFFTLGVLLSTFFWLPALYDLKYVKLPQIQVSNPQEYLSNIFDIFSLLPITNSIGAYSFLGLLPLLLLASLTIVLIKNKKDYISIIIFIFMSLSIFLMTKNSKFIWGTFTFLSAIQFPWRLSALVMFTSSLLAAIFIEKYKKSILLAVIVLTASISVFKFLSPSEYNQMSDQYYATNEGTTTVKDEYMPIWVTEKPSERANEKFQPNENITILQEGKNAKEYKARIEAKESSILTVNTIYFPGHTATLDGREVAVTSTHKQGLISLQLPTGIHEVIIKYGKTPVHLLAEYVSLAAFLTTGLLFYFIWRKQNFL